MRWPEHHCKSYRKSDKTLIEFFKKPDELPAFWQRLNYCLITLFRQGLRRVLAYRK
jgi:hypothetical protein